ncbi:THAP domain-containing protein 3 [Oncorhynchus clarkii lewisi]|uniref:THAP domain-containing protein 3 n=1 Tax=Oncorhynchus clarkii lewisi TaxID=490388 RepID=UPI0039B83D75
MPKSCSAYNCTNRYSKHTDITFHRFPFSKPTVFRQWLDNICRDDFYPKKHMVICSLNFTMNCFSGLGNRKNLLWNAVPTLFTFPPPNSKKRMSGKRLKMLPKCVSVSQEQRLHVACKSWDIFSFQELCTDLGDMRQCIIMVKHEVMAAARQRASGSRHVYACPYHNPTMGLSVDNVDIRKPLTHTTPYTLSAICSVQLKPGFIHEEHASPVCQWPSKHVVISDHSYSLSDPCAVKAQLFKALDTNTWLNRRLQMKSQLINKMRFKLKAARAELSSLRSWTNLSRAAGKVSIWPSVQRIAVNDIS